MIDRPKGRHILTDENEPMTASDLLVYLECMRDANIPLHKVIVRIEVSDDFYDKDLYESNVNLTWYKRDGSPTRYLVLHGD